MTKWSPQAAYFSQHSHAELQVILTKCIWGQFLTKQRPQAAIFNNVLTICVRDQFLSKYSPHAAIFKMAWTECVEV